MKLLWLYLSAFLLLPVIGEYLLWISDITISAGSVSTSLLLKNIIFVIIILFTAYLTQSYKRTKEPIKVLFHYTYAKKIYKNAIIVFIFLILIIFVLGGYKIVLGIAGRGEVRASLGVFGPIYTLSLSYLPSVILVFISVIYIHLKKDYQKKLKKKLVLLYSFAIVLGIISGYKSVAIMIMIPGFVVLYLNNFNIKKMIVFMILGVIILTLFTAIVRHEDVVTSFSFLIYRATTMTAYGAIGVWNVFPNGIPIEDVFINFLGAFGEKIASILLNISPHEPEFLKTNLSRLITYKVYPDIDRALSGAVNVTVTNFGHALYIFGKNFYVFYAFIMGVIIGLVIRAFRKYIIKGYPLKSSLVALYFFNVIIPSINSGGIFMLFSLPVFVYLIMTYFIIKYTIYGKKKIYV